MSSAPSEPPAPQPAGVNVLGLAGFIIGVMSFCVAGGLLAPIGLLLSFLGLFKRPRGWAVAGTVVNLASLCCCLPAVLPFVLVVTGLVSVSAMALWISDTFKGALGAQGVTAVHTTAFVWAVMLYFAEHQRVPESLDELKLDPRVLTDGWGNPFHYEVTEDPEGFRFWSTGRDGTEGTGDDLEFEGVVRSGALDFRERSRSRSAPAAP